VRWPGLAEVRGRVDGAALADALPEAGGVSVLSASRHEPGGVPEEALSAVVEAARADGRPVVVDLPRGAPPDTGAVVLGEADLAVLVVPSRLRAVSAAASLVRFVDGWSAATLVLRPVPGGLRRGEAADLVGRPVFAELGHDRSAAAREEHGRPPAIGPRTPLGILARRLLAELPARTGVAA
jgi:hypothetical protein